MRGEWETRDQKLILYLTYILKLAEFFDDISFHHIPREENQMVNALATLASMFQLAPHGDLLYIEFRSRGKPPHCFAIEEERDGKPWNFDIKQYVENKEYPPWISDNDKRMLRRLTTGFFVSGIVLYKRSHDMTLLRCVDAKEANYMIEEVHGGSFGTHANGHAMAKKILRAGYYWLNMESDCCTHVRKCHKCQAYTDNVNVPPHPLNIMSAPLAFFHVGDRCHRGHRTQGFERSMLHSRGDRLFHQMGRKCFLYQCHEECSCQIHKEGTDLSIQTPLEDHD